MNVTQLGTTDQELIREALEHFAEELRKKYSGITSTSEWTTLNAKVEEVGAMYGALTGNELPSSPPKKPLLEAGKSKEFDVSNPVIADRLIPYWRQPPEVRREIFNYMLEGNSKCDLLVLLLERYSEQEIVTLVAEQERARKELEDLEREIAKNGGNWIR